MKIYYEKQEDNSFRYLLPHEVWNDKKIFKKVNLLSKDIDELIKTNNLNKITLQNVIEKHIPEIKDKIKISDFEDYRKMHELRGASPDFVNLQIEKSRAIIGYGFSDNVEIFFKKFDLYSKKYILHELIHCLEKVFQNKLNISTFKCNKKGKCTFISDKIFGSFEKNKEVVEIPLIKNERNNYIINETLKSVLRTLINNLKIKGELNFKNNSLTWEGLFNDFEINARRERKAYRASPNLNIKLRYKRREEFFKNIKNTDFWKEFSEEQNAQLVS